MTLGTITFLHEITAVFLAVIDMALFLDENVRLKLTISFKLVHQSYFKTMLKILRMKLYWWNCIVKSSTFISQKKSSIAVIIQKRCRKGIFSLFLRFYSFFFDCLLKLFSLNRNLAEVGEKLHAPFQG